MRVFVLAVLSLCAVLLTSGCNQGGAGALSPMSEGDDGGTGGDDALVTPPDDAGNNGSPSTMYPAPFPAPPQVVTANGPVLAAPRIIPVFFANNDPTFRTQLEDFDNKVGRTNYWKAATSEYGVGIAVSTKSVHLPEKATGTLADADISAWLAGKLNGNDPLFPAADANSVYVLHYPEEVTITLPSQRGTSTSCTDFGGYHSDVKLDGNHKRLDVAYAVIPHCASFGNLTGIDSITATESHELVEASTDPYPHSDPAFGQVDDDHLYWAFALGGGETGDMCAQDPSSFTRFPELPYMVQRSWSNAAVAAGNDPCVPAPPNQVYFNAVPALTEAITVGGQFTVLGVSVPVGESRTIDVDLFSNGDTKGPFTVHGSDAARLTGGTATLALSLDRTQGRNGEKLHLTIKTLKASQFGVGLFVLTSTIGKVTHYWFGLVGEQ